MDAFITPALIALAIFASWDVGRRLTSRTDTDLEQDEVIAELQERCDNNASGICEVRETAERALRCAVPAADTLFRLEAKLDSEIANRKSNDALRLAATRGQKGGK